MCVWERWGGEGGGEEGDIRSTYHPLIRWRKTKVKQSSKNTNEFILVKIGMKAKKIGKKQINEGDEIQ